MPYTCIWFDEIPDGPWQPGWCFPYSYQLSRRYLEADSATRPAIAVVVPLRHDEAWNRRVGYPRGTALCIDAYPIDDPEGSWDVTITGPLIDGAQPDITVTPSIEVEGVYHGHLTNGILTDDIDALTDADLATIEAGDA
jgi:hypothetical protein